MNEISNRHLLRMLFEMKRIRHYEETIAARYSEGKMRCPTHLSTGQEAVPAAIGCLLGPQDLAVSTHRCHAHYLGKGGNAKKMVAELYGKATGCSRGIGGSMHLIDLDCGFKGSTAIVANSIPVGVGLAMAIQLDRTAHLACIFLGDGAVEEGAFYESLNLAVVRKLPVLFVCENNFYSVYSNLSVRQPLQRKIHKLAEVIGAKSALADGNNAIEVYQVLEKTISSIRKDPYPHFLEFTTYRWREHCGPNFDNALGYRTETEFREWQLKDPIHRHEAVLKERRLIIDAEIEEMDKKVQHEVSEAFSFAESSPFPDVSSGFSNLYAS